MRIVGVEVPENKVVWSALTRIYGIGDTRAKIICKILNISDTFRARDLSNDQVRNIEEFISTHFVVESDLKKDISNNIRKKISINLRSALRMQRGLPARGQNTRTNHKTAKKRLGIGGSR